MSARLISLLLAAPCVAMAAGPTYTVVGDNAAELAQYQQQRPAAEKFSAELDALSKTVSRFIQRGQVTTAQVRDVDGQIRTMLAAADQFPLFKSKFGECRSAAFALQERWQVALDRWPGDAARVENAYKGARRDCSTALHTAPVPEFYARTAPGSKPPPGCKMILDVSKENPKYQDWSCPKK